MSFQHDVGRCLASCLHLRNTARICHGHGRGNTVLGLARPHPSKRPASIVILSEPRLQAPPGLVYVRGRPRLWITPGGLGIAFRWDGVRREGYGPGCRPVSTLGPLWVTRRWCVCLSVYGIWHGSHDETAPWAGQHLFRSSTSTLHVLEPWTPPPSAPYNMCEGDPGASARTLELHMSGVIGGLSRENEQMFL